MAPAHASWALLAVSHASSFAAGAPASRRWLGISLIARASPLSGATIAKRARDTQTYKRSYTAVIYGDPKETLPVADPVPSQLEFLKVEEVAALLKIKEKTVREWIARGDLEAYKIGKEWRIRRDHLEQALESRRVTTRPAPGGGLWDPEATVER
jgi:excisionase family DNA binding protein